MSSLRLALATAAVVGAVAGILLHGGTLPIQRLLSAYASLLAWLAPPYIYFVLNAIILSIAAASHFHTPPADPTDAMAPSPLLRMDVHQEQEYLPQVEYEEELGAMEKASAAGEKKEETELVLAAEEPPVSVCFGHRKNVKPAVEDEAPRKMARPRREETLESTWRAIMERRGRHLKKADTRETRAERGNRAGKPVAVMQLVRVRREASPGPEELKQRVEAFIKRFNEEMRLQRQQSQQQQSQQQQFMDMVSCDSD